ncbi:ABC transporter ATP-binding protein [Mesorhizobium sp. INR15]|uniref:ABC transporter ATP-binding protein n=1 Tax=Mesorhizobium sp. INR15 TaxID=2654248 RepID=UPI0018964CB9|nr:ABC transporter ATP-binding protein [Mesorhizobium sp. INR15]QPC91787.1 sn-glycerol-3-phosphate ABC transporter ATP-binding protein UgpC [Mesorhizobium sp. INR15]
MAGLELENIKKSFGAVDVIRDVSLSINEGEFVVLVGPSGCGKSTLLRCIAGLEPVSSGRMVQDGTDITSADPVKRGVAMVFQSYALYPHMTVAQNIGFGLKIAGEKKPVIDARVIEIAKLLKLETLLARKPRALSGGQRQRVAIGRALARSPKLFLFDEPLSNLDASLRAEMRVELAKLHATLGNTMIYVTHDQVEGMTLADRIVIMNSGIVEQVGAPLDLFNHPENKFVAGFLGQPSINFVKVMATHRDGTDVTVTLPGGESLKLPIDPARAGDLDGVELGIRPEDVSVSASGGGLKLTIDVIEHLGNETILYGHLVDGQTMTIRLTGQARFAAGQELLLDITAASVIIFDRNGKNIRMKAA